MCEKLVLHGFAPRPEGAGLLAVFVIAVAFRGVGCCWYRKKCVVKHVKKDVRACVYEVYDNDDVDVVKNGLDGTWTTNNIELDSLCEPWVDNTYVMGW